MNGHKKNSVVVPAQAHGNLARLSHGSAIWSEHASGVPESLGSCHQHRHSAAQLQ